MITTKELGAQSMSLKKHLTFADLNFVCFHFQNRGKLTADDILLLFECKDNPDAIFDMIDSDGSGQVRNQIYIPALNYSFDSKLKITCMNLHLTVYESTLNYKHVTTLNCRIYKLK